MESIKEQRETLVSIIQASNNIVALTGAGISTASGIPDFRGKEGLWKDQNPAEVATMTVFKENPAKFWDFYRHRLDIPNNFEPNGAHKFLSYLENQGKLKAIITQNIDGLHQAAGVLPDKIYQVHGSLTEVACYTCGHQLSREEVYDLIDNSEERIPYCQQENCDGVIKPKVVLFEEMIPEEEIEKSYDALAEANLILLIGSSMGVEPVSLALRWLLPKELCLV